MLILILSVTIQSFFSPGGGVRDAIIEEIRGAKQQIDVAMYILTDRELSNAIVDASNRGVEVRVILDELKSMEIKILSLILLLPHLNQPRRKPMFPISILFPEKTSFLSITVFSPNIKLRM